jgi:MarR family transcriptional regulator, transcriptional regulator for hemolysin
MEKSPFLDEYYKLWLLLSQTRSAIYKARHKKFGRYMHPNQAAALVMIQRYDGEITPTVLANHLFLEPHSISELVDRMQKKGLVMKTKDKNKGHVVRISLTEKGHDLSSELVQMDFIRTLMGSLTATQRKQLWNCLSTLFQATLKELNMENKQPVHFRI